MSNLPNGWQFEKLGHCIIRAPEYGANSPSIDYAEHLPRYIRITDIGDDGRLHPNGKVSVPVKGNEKYVLKDGDFLFARSGATVGKAYVYRPQDGWAIFAGYLIRFRPDPTVLLPEFLLNYVQSHQYWHWVRSTLRAGAQPNINAQEFASLPLPLPTIPEQKRIVEILFYWDEVIAKTKQVIINMDLIKKGLVQRLLEGEVRFPGFDNVWDEMELGQFLKPVSRKVEKPKDGYLRLGLRSHGKGTFTSTLDEADSEAVAMSHLFKVKKGDLIVNITFAWEGAIAIVEKDGDGAFVSHRFPTYIFNTKKVLPDYFRYVMLTKRFFYDLGLISPGGAGRNRVMSKKDFLKLKINVPSIEEQEKIGGTLQAVDGYINTLSRKLELLQQQKKGLMQRLLTGQVRVKI